MTSKAKKSSTKTTPETKTNNDIRVATDAKPSPKANAALKPKGKRYSDVEKAEVLQFVHSYNTQNGRGGQTAATKKFGISQLSLAAWLKADSTGWKSGTKTTGSSFATKLTSLSKLHGAITQAEKELKAMKAKFASLKAGL